MEDSILRVIAYSVFFFVIAMVSVPIKKYVRKRGLKKYPMASDLKRVKTEVRILLNEKQNYPEIIANLKSKFPYPKYMMEGFIIDVENEEMTLLEYPRKITKSGFTFSCPQNWKMKPLAHDLDEEKYFTVEGSYSGIISFCIYTEMLDELPNLMEINKVIGDQYQTYQIKETVSKWGDFQGSGNLFKATVLNNELAGMNFLYKTKNVGFYISLAAMNDDRQNVIDGFIMVEESFKQIDR